MLFGGKWGNTWSCPICYSSNSGARLKCLTCEYLYAAPVSAKREWVDLTDDEFQKIKNSLSRQHGWDGDGWDLALKEAVLSAFKEKNT